jgi:cyclopropane-fatty-acyl-phospholipid synthase
MAQTHSRSRPSAQVGALTGAARGATSGFNRWCRERLLAQIREFQDCELTVIDGAETLQAGVVGADLRCTIEILDPQMWRMSAFGGTVGAGESYMEGHWRCSNLTTLVQMFVRNRAIMDRLERGTARFSEPLLKAFHWVNRNTKAGSRKNIAAHYDLGNDLFELFLDETMMYSSAVYTDADDTLATAAVNKLDRICRKLNLSANDHVLEIGTGWGGFAMHAATHYGARVTTATISQEQFDLATKRIAERGLQDRITVLLKDYRELEGQYDKLVSIEMIEAVGHHFLDTYFAKCSQLLKSSGMMLLQAITIEDHRYRNALTSVDFIKRYIFPGSFIPSVSAMLNAAARATDMRLFHLEDIGPSYALTLKAWRERFQSNLPRVQALGYPDRFVRMWEYYLCYCEGGFLERSISNAQMLLVKPANRRAEILPAL